MVTRSAREGLVRSCEGGDWVRTWAPGEGVELLRARFTGRAYARHRHDTYAIGLTELGVQTFDYRGRVESSRPGQVVVLHPDEPHDGRAGAEGGFGYRIVYVEPARIAAAVRARARLREPDTGRRNRGRLPVAAGAAGARRPDPAAGRGPGGGGYQRRVRPRAASPRPGGARARPRAPGRPSRRRAVGRA